MGAFISALQRPVSKRTNAPIPEILAEISLDEYKKIYNKTKESTASYPPIHYGHYKAFCEDDDLAEVNRIFMTLPFKLG